MSAVEQKPVNMTRTYITLAVVVWVIAVAVLYSQGWFSQMGSGYQMEGNKAGTEQGIDREKENAEAVPATQSTTSPVATPTN